MCPGWLLHGNPKAAVVATVTRRRMKRLLYLFNAVADMVQRVSISLISSPTYVSVDKIPVSMLTFISKFFTNCIIKAKLPAGRC